MFQRITNYFEARIGYRALVEGILREYRVPRDAQYMSTLGFVALVFFLVQVFTGLLMLISYIPHPDHAFSSVLFLMNSVPFGWLIRMTHVVCSNVLIGLLMLHIVYTFWRGAFSRPRELTWLTGALMALVVFCFLASGSLLPWNQVGYWSATVLTSIPTVIPVVGDWIVTFLRGGEEITELTLRRFFAFHVAFLPLFSFLFIGIHVFLVLRKNLSSLSEPVQDQKNVAPSEFKRDHYPEGTPYYSQYFMMQSYMVVLILAFVYFAISYMPSFFLTETAYVEADPTHTPEMIRPAWYFSSSFQFLKVVPDKFFGIITIVFMYLLFVLWPFFDKHGTEKKLSKRPSLLGFFLFGIGFWIVLTVWGRFF